MTISPSLIDVFVLLHTVQLCSRLSLTRLSPALFYIISFSVHQVIYYLLNCKIAFCSTSLECVYFTIRQFIQRW